MGNCMDISNANEPRGFISMRELLMQAKKKQKQNQEYLKIVNGTNQNMKKGFVTIKQLLIQYDRKQKQKIHQIEPEKQKQNKGKDKKDSDKDKQKNNAKNSLSPQKQVSRLMQSTNNNFASKINVSENQDTVSSNNNRNTVIKPYKNLIWQIISFIKQKSRLLPIISLDFFNNLSEYVDMEYWPDYFEVILAKYLILYITCSTAIQARLILSQKSSNQQKIRKNVHLNIGKFPQNYGKILYKLIIDVKQKNTRILQNLQYAQTFLNRQILFEQNIIQNGVYKNKLIHEIQNYQYDTYAALLFIYSYFVKQCEYLYSNSRCSLSQINNRIYKQIQLIRQFLIGQIAQNKKYLLQYEPEQFKKIKDQQHEYDNLNLAKQLSAQFILQQTKQQGDNNKSKIRNKNQQFDSCVSQLVQQTKKYMGFLVETTSTLCYQNDGFQYQPILRFNNGINSTSTGDPSSFRIQYLVDKANLFVKKISKAQKIKQKTIEDLRKEQIKSMQQQMLKIFEIVKLSQIQSSEIVTLVIKCSFCKLNNLNKTASKIIKKFEQTSKQNGQKLPIKLLSVKNRLFQQTSDILLKFQVRQFFIQVRLTLSNSQLPNPDIIHNLTQLLQSPFFSTITILHEKYKLFVYKFFRHAEMIVMNRKNDDAQNYHKKIVLLKKLLGYSNIANRVDGLENSGNMRGSSKSQYASQISLKQDYINYENVKKKLQEVQKAIKETFSSNLSNLAQRMPIRTAKCYTQLKKYQKAFQAIGKYKHNHDQQYLFEIGQIYYNLGYFQRAIQAYKQLYQIQEGQIKNGSSKVNDHMYSSINSNKSSTSAYSGMDTQQKRQIILKNQAECEFQVCMYANAQKTYELLLEYQKIRYGQISRQCARTELSLGKILFHQGKTQQAIIRYQRSINIIQAVDAERNPDYFRAFCSLASTYAHSGQLSSASQAIYHALQLKQKLSCQDSIQNIGLLTEVGNVYKSMNKYNQAQQCMKRAVDKAEILTGIQSSYYYECLLNLADIYRLMQQYQKCKYILQMCQDLVVKIFGKLTWENSEINYHYGLYLTSRSNNSEDLKQAVKYFELAIKILQKIQEDQCPNFQVICHNIAMVYLKLKNYDKCMQYYDRVAGIVLKLYGKNSIPKAQILCMIANVQQKRQDLQQAQAFYEQAIRTLQSLQVQNFSLYLQALRSLAYLFIKLSDYRKAEQILTKTMKVYQKYLVKSAQYADIVHLLASVSHQLSKQYQTRQLLRKALNMYKYLKNQALVLEVEQQLNDLKGVKKSIDRAYSSVNRKKQQNKNNEKNFQKQ